MLLLSSCQRIDPTVYECQQLLEEINNIVIDAQTITQPEQGLTQGEPNLDLWLQAADVLQKGSQAIAALPIKSDTLQDYQTKISTIYDEQAQATYEMVQAWQEKDLEKAQSAKQKAQQAGQQEQVTGTSLNNYCQDKETDLKSR